MPYDYIDVRNDNRVYQLGEIPFAWIALPSGPLLQAHYCPLLKDAHHGIKYISEAAVCAYAVGRVCISRINFAYNKKSPGHIQILLNVFIRTNAARKAALALLCAHTLDPDFRMLVCFDVLHRICSMILASAGERVWLNCYPELKKYME